MHSACRIVSVDSVLLAVAEAEVPRGQVPTYIRVLFDGVYSWPRTAPVKQTGHNYVLYDVGTGRNLLVRAGFPVSAAFAETERVRSLTLAAGEAAHAVHTGPYHELPRTYSVLQAWCKQEKLQLAAQSWELYGDWQQDESKLETGIYLRLQ